MSSESANTRRRNLGRGLSALFGEDDEALEAAAAPGLAEDSATPPTDANRPNRMVALSQLKPSPFQPRRRFDDAAMAELVESVRARGVLQPILVRPDPNDDGFEIIAGERRWRAAQEAQLHDVPVVVRTFSDREVLEVALVENLQRQDLSPLEEAEGYARLMAEFAHTQEQLAEAVGKSRSHVANMLRLLGLPDDVKEMVSDGRLSMGHARALLGAESPSVLARQVVGKQMSVRQTEAAARKPDQPVQSRARSGKGEAAARSDKDPDTVALERDLANLLGLKVEITFGGRGGSLTLHYETLEQLDDILHRLNPPDGSGYIAG
ncbi:ParB/RepB/Spo0J family partition protein [Roseospirillum parvum]|nr:ParB/RepB/Spo0J family partition protein [Roseospirillum parvum]